MRYSPPQHPLSDNSHLHGHFTDFPRPAAQISANAWIFHSKRPQGITWISIHSRCAFPQLRLVASLTALHINRVEGRPESLIAAASVLRARALKAAIKDTETDFVVDIVDTGGDGYNLFNVSTTAAIVAAGAGARVIKVIFL